MFFLCKNVPDHLGGEFEISTGVRNAWRHNIWLQSLLTLGK